MGLIVHEPPHVPLAPDVLAAWREIPTTVISDVRNRAGAMAAAIKPVAEGMRFAGEALTVETVAGDILAVHHAAAMTWPGAALVIDAGGYAERAVWARMMCAQAAVRGVAGVVVDGSVRDIAEVRRSVVPVFARHVVPVGPHMGWGGTVNETVQCGGCVVAPGDIVVGDDDGVAVVPRDRLAGILAACRKRMADEERIKAEIAAGRTTVEIYGLPGPGEES